MTFNRLNPFHRHKDITPFSTTTAANEANTMPAATTQHDDKATSKAHEESHVDTSIAGMHVPPARQAEIDQDIQGLVSLGEQREKWIVNEFLPQIEDEIDSVLGKVVDSLIDVQACGKLSERLSKISGGKGKIDELLLLIDQLEEKKAHSNLSHDESAELNHINDIMDDLHVIWEVESHFEENLELVRKHPIHNFDTTVRGLFLNFEEDLKHIYGVRSGGIISRIKHYGESEHSVKTNMLLSAAFSSLGAFMIDTYIHNLKKNSENNPAFKAVDADEDAMRKELVENFYPIAFPHLKDNHNLMAEARKEIAASILLRASGFADLMLADTVISGGDKLAADTGIIVGFGAFEASMSINLTEIPKMKFQLEEDSPLLEAEFRKASDMKKEIEEITGLLRSVQKGESKIDKELEQRLAERLKIVETQLKLANSNIQKLGKATVKVLVLSAELSILNQVLKVANVSLSQASSSKELVNGACDCIETVLNSMDKALNEIESALKSGANENALKEIGIQFLGNAKGVVNQLNSYTKAIAQVIDKAMPLEKVLAFTLAIAPVIHVIGLGMLAGMHALNIKHCQNESERKREIRDEMIKRNAMVQTMVLDNKSVISCLDSACTIIKKSKLYSITGSYEIPSTKLDKHEKKEILEKYAALKKKIHQCKNIDDFQAILDEIKELEIQKTAIVSQMKQVIVDLEKDIEFKSDKLGKEKAENLSDRKKEEKRLKEEKKQIEEERQDCLELVEEAEQLDLIDLRLEAFRSPELFEFGLQLCMRDFFSAELRAEEEKKARSVVTISQGSKKVIPFDPASDALSKGTDARKEKHVAPVDSQTGQIADKPLADRVSKGHQSVLGKISHKFNDLIGAKMFKHTAKKMCDGNLEKHIGDWLGRLDEIERNNPNAMKDLYSTLLEWTLKETCGLSERHVQALNDFRKHAPPNIREQFEANLTSILANKYKSAEKDLFYADMNLMNAVGYGGFHATHFLLFATAGVGSLSNPITASIVASLGVAGAVAYTIGKAKSEQFPDTPPELIRQQKIFQDALNFLLNTTWEEELAGTSSEVDPETLRLAKEAGMMMAGFDLEAQKRAKAIFALSLYEIPHTELQFYRTILQPL